VSLVSNIDKNYIKVDIKNIYELIGMCEYFNHITIFYSSLNSSSSGSGKEILMTGIKGKLLELLTTYFEAEKETR